MKKLFSFMFAIILVISCSDPITSDGSSTGSTGGDNVNLSRIQVLDGNGNSLGYATTVNSMMMTLYTNNGYFVTLNWKGELFETSVYFTGSDGSGTPFMANIEYYPLTSSYAQKGYNGVIYRISNIDANGIGIADPSITSYSSYCIADGSYLNFDPAQPTTASYSVFPLTPTTRSTIGLPDTITLPLSLKFN